MVVVRSQELDALETPNGNILTALATPSRGATEVRLVRQRQEPGGFNPPHSHDREEVMLQLEGRVSVSCEGQEVILESGDALIIPAGTLHRVTNAGDVPADWLIVSPAGTRFFSESGEEMKPGWVS